MVNFNSTYSYPLPFLPSSHTAHYLLLKDIELTATRHKFQNKILSIFMASSFSEVGADSLYSHDDEATLAEYTYIELPACLPACLPVDRTDRSEPDLGHR